MKFVVSPLLVILATALASGLPAALADAPDRSRAEALLKQGNTLYDRADYRGALAKFQQAHALFPTPEIELNIGLTQEHLRDLPAAASHFESFLGKVEREGNAARVRGIRQKLEVLRKKLGSITVVCTVRGAVVTVDGKPAGSTPLRHRLYVTAGRHSLVVIATGKRPFKEVLELGAGQHQTLEVKLLHLAPGAREPGTATPGLSPPPPPVRSVSRPFYKRWWFWTAVGVAVAGAATAAVVATQTGGSDRLPGGELMTVPPSAWSRP